MSLPRAFLATLLMSGALLGCTTDDPSIATNSPPVGALEDMSPEGVVSGWAYDPDRPSANIYVNVYLDGPAGSKKAQFIESVKADQPREDVNQSLGVPGKHGFSYRIPDKFRDGKTHEIYAWGVDLSAGKDSMLARSPKTALLLLPGAKHPSPSPSPSVAPSPAK